ncbi:FtsX-like permease family protein [Streptosporangium sp. NPDC006930]|uniref:FtsX-like permease family protein n=1 Tax=Streptosporangium sp. NPDC006930 TaxID=3154783 RepID=UPI003420B3F4
MSALLAALRISRRDIRRARGRSALIMVMIGLPVLVITGLLAFLETSNINPREGLTANIGAADARITVSGVRGKVEQDVEGRIWVGSGQPPHTATRPWTQGEVAKLLEPGTRLLPLNEGSVDYLSSDGRDHVSVLETDLRDPMTTGMYHLLRGRFPASAQEIAVTPEILERGARLDAPLQVTRDRKAMRVVGVVEHPHRTRGAKIVGLPGTLLFAGHGLRGTGWLADAPQPVTWATVQRLNAAGLLAGSRAVIEDPPDRVWLFTPDSYQVDRTVAIGLAAVMIVLEVVLLAGPAFAVGLRRRRRELALITAQGGSPAHLRLIVLADGVVLGGGAALAGLILGLGLVALSAALGAGRLVGAVGPLEIPWIPVVAVALLGAGSGLIAALIPAVQAARQDAAAVIGGRRSAVRDRVGRPVLGLVLVAAGVAATVFAVRYDVIWVLAAAVLSQLGLVALTPRLVKGAASLVARLSLPLRLAARDAARHRVRTASAVAAVMTATATVVVAGIATTSSFAQRRDAFQVIAPAGTTRIDGEGLDADRWSALRAAVERTLPGVPLIEAAKLRNAEGENVEMAIQRADEYGPQYSVAGLPIGDERLLTLVQGRRDPAAAAAFASGKAVVFDPGMVRNGKITLILEGRRGEADPVEIAVPAVLARPADPGYGVAVLPLSVAENAGLRAEPRVLYIDPAAHRLTAKQVATLEWDLVTAVPKAEFYVEVTSGFQDDNTSWLVLLLGAALVLVLGGTFVATGLAAADMRPDLATMAAVGAPPGTHRLVVAGQAGFIAGLGVLVGTVAGCVTGIAATWPLTVGAPGTVLIRSGELSSFSPMSPTVEIPWLLLAAVVVGLPVLAALVAGAFTRPKVTLTRRTG